MAGDTSQLRKKAGESAVEFVKDGMVIGVGTGRTNGHFIDCLGERFQRGDLKNISAVPTSESSAARLRTYGIPIVRLVDHPTLDLAIDGADEVDPDLNLIKGLGRALLREKVVEVHALKFLVVVDESKLVQRLGTSCPLPVEILPFQAESHVRWLGSICSRSELLLALNGSPIVTDNGNFLAHCWFDGGIPNPYELDHLLNQRPGILEHGLFLDMATTVLVAGMNQTRLLERQNGR